MSKVRTLLVAGVIFLVGGGLAYAADTSSGGVAKDRLK